MPISGTTIQLGDLSIEAVCSVHGHDVDAVHAPRDVKPEPRVGPRERQWLARVSSDPVKALELEK